MLLGLGLPVGAVLTVGRRTAVVLVGTLIAGSVGAIVVGRLPGLHRESATLVAVGTTICGASAIAAATAVIKPDRERVAYALGTIFVFNVVAVLVYPPIGRLLGLSQEAFGLWAGTAINDTSSVLAAGLIFGSAAAHFAVIVKLVRSLMIVPMCLGLHFAHRNTIAKTPLWRTFPLFVIFFSAASVSRSGHRARRVDTRAHPTEQLAHRRRPRRHRHLADLAASTFLRNPPAAVRRDPRPDPRRKQPRVADHHRLALRRVQPNQTR